MWIAWMDRKTCSHLTSHFPSHFFFHSSHFHFPLDAGASSQIFKKKIGIPDGLTLKYSPSLKTKSDSRQTRLGGITRTHRPLFRVVTPSSPESPLKIWVSSIKMIGGDGMKMEERVVRTILNTISESSDDDEDQVSQLKSPNVISCRCLSLWLLKVIGFHFLPQNRWSV